MPHHRDTKLADDSHFAMAAGVSMAYGTNGAIAGPHGPALPQGA